MSDLGDFTDFDPDDEGDPADRETTGGADEATDRAATGAPRTEEAAGGDGSGARADEDFERVDVSPTGEDRGLGVLSATEGLRISEDDDETELRAYVTVANRSDVRIGKYLLVPYPDEAATAASPERTSGHADGERLFCRITALEYAQEFRADDATEIHARRAMRQDGIDEEDFKFVATLEPVAVLYSEDGELKRRMTDRVPKPETPVREATDTGEIKTGLKIPEDGVFLGHL
ncbi:MAG: AAA family ATPase, partial [Haloarculaceae archaeon]